MRGGKEKVFCRVNTCQMAYDLAKLSRVWLLGVNERKQNSGKIEMLTGRRKKVTRDVMVIRLPNIFDKNYYLFIKNVFI